MRIKVNTYVIVITFLTGLIATILGAWAWLSPETFPGPSGVGAPTHTMLSWGARELAMALSSWIVIFYIKDARGYAVALGSAILRESLDFIDGFRIADTPGRLFLVVGVSVILHGIALYMSIRAINKHNEEHPAVATDVLPEDSS